MASKPSTPTKLCSKRTARFKKQLSALPPDIQELSEKLFALFEIDQNDPQLGTKALNDTSSGRHRQGSYSTRITLRYRAIYVIDKGENGDQERQYCWYWVGSRQDYANFVGAY